MPRATTQVYDGAAYADKAPQPLCWSEASQRAVAIDEPPQGTRAGPSVLVCGVQQRQQPDRLTLRSKAPSDLEGDQPPGPGRPSQEVRSRRLDGANRRKVVDRHRLDRDRNSLAAHPV